MQLRELHLWWKKDGQDIDLGTAFGDDVPHKDDVFGHATDHGTVWRVVLVCRHLIAYGSPSWINWQAGQYVHPRWVDVFVEPAEGPFES